MGLFAQGTVQVKQSDRQYKLIINPAAGYRARHKDKDYTVFLGDDITKSRCFPADAEFTAEDPLKNVLALAACNHLKIGIEIPDDGKDHVIGIHVPAAGS